MRSNELWTDGYKSKD